MRMRGKKVIFTDRDVWNLNDTLRPVILAGLIKYKESLMKDEMLSTPSGITNTHCMVDSDDSAAKEWFENLDKMIYSFGDNEPDIEEYDASFSMSFVDDPDWKESEGGPKTRIVDLSANENFEKYQEALMEHERKVKEGLALFGKHYDDLWS